MKQVEITQGLTPIAPRTTEMSIYPDIDETFSTYTYQGRRPVIRTSQVAGIRTWSSTIASGQGFAIYGNIAVRMCNTSVSTTHYVYRIDTDGGIMQLASFTLTGTGHSNALQFSPVLEAGQTLPYLYVTGTTNKCYVLSFDSSYQATIVQTITISGDYSQILMGDDGFIWSSMPGEDDHRRFRKYRKVAVSEGDVTLTDDDKVDDWETFEVYGNNYTAQGWKIKFGLLWFGYGAAGSSNKRGFTIYDTATHECFASVDFSAYATLEWEDFDFYNNGILAAMANGSVYEIKL